MDDDTILLVAGSEDQLAWLKRLRFIVARSRARGTVIVAGNGEVRSTVTDRLTEGGVCTVVIDREDVVEVDVLSDATGRGGHRDGRPRFGEQPHRRPLRRHDGDAGPAVAR